MYAKKPRYTPLVLLLILLVMVGVLAGSTYAKYIYSTQLTATVTFSAKLADSITLQEHKAVRAADGSYSLGEETVATNTYTLLPGLDIPKDPHVTITGKTPLPAYLYIEVVDGVSNEVLDYAINDQWTLVKDGDETYTGEHGGTVYVYTGGTGVALPLIQNPDEPIPVLQDDEIRVSQKLNKYFDPRGESLTFYACMSEIPSGEGEAKDLISVYEAAYNT